MFHFCSCSFGCGSLFCCWQVLPAWQQAHSICGSCGALVGSIGASCKERCLQFTPVMIKTDYLFFIKNTSLQVILRITTGPTLWEALLLIICQVCQFFISLELVLFLPCFNHSEGVIQRSFLKVWIKRLYIGKSWFKDIP